jgi:hypothetical protein
MSAGALYPPSRSCSGYARGCPVKLEFFSGRFYRRDQMQVKRWRTRIWSTRLSLLALALNALVPVHLAFDLVEALRPACQAAHEEADTAERHLLALISGHREAECQADEHGRHGHSHHHECAVCSALGTLAGLTAPALVVLSAPAPAALPAALPLDQHKAFGTLAGYRSRAPPSA